MNSSRLFIEEGGKHIRQTEDYNVFLNYSSDVLMEIFVLFGITLNCCRLHLFSPDLFLPDLKFKQQV